VPQGVLVLVVAAVVLFIFLVGVVVGLMAVHSHYRHKTYVARRQYDLINRELDRNPNARLAELNIGHLQDDLPWGRREDANDAHHRPPLLVDDNDSPRSETRPKSLPVPMEPGS
jgi:hypothetical protein